MDDVPLAEAQVIWEWQDEKPIGDRPPVKVVRILTTKDDDRYISSWGACNSDFNQATAAEKLAMLFRQFHWMVLADKVAPRDVHEALLVIPEYRAAIHPELIPSRLRQHD